MTTIPPIRLTTAEARALLEAIDSPPITNVDAAWTAFDKIEQALAEASETGPTDDDEPTQSAGRVRARSDGFCRGRRGLWGLNG